MFGKWLAAGCITEIILYSDFFFRQEPVFKGQRDDSPSLDQGPEHTGASFGAVSTARNFERSAPVRMRVVAAHALEPTLQLAEFSH